MRGPDHRVPEILKDPDDRVADDRGAQVADVQFLGDVRAGVVDDDFVRGLSRGEAEAGGGQLLAGLGGDPVAVQGDVDEPGATHLGRPDYTGQVEVAGEFCSD